MIPASFDTTYQIAEYLRAGSAKTIANPHATEEEKRIGSFKGTLLTYLEDHGTAAFLDYAKDEHARLTALYEPTDIPEDIQTELVRQIAITEVVIGRLQNLN